MQKRKGASWPFFVVIIAVILVVSGALSFNWMGETVTLGGVVTQITDGVIDVGDGDNSCSGGQTQSYDPNAHDENAPATALTESTNIYRPVGQTAWTSFTQGTGITGLQTGLDYEFIYGINTNVL